MRNSLADATHDPVAALKPIVRARASYDLTRLRRNRLIARVHGRNLYRLTADGLAFAIFYTKGPQPSAHAAAGHQRAPAPPPLRAALHTITSTSTHGSPMRDYRSAAP
jgi:hypothetical protein